MEMYAFLLRPGLAALDNLADKFVAGWLLPSKVLDLSYPTPSLSLLVFAIQRAEGRQLAGKSTASRRRYRGQDSIIIIIPRPEGYGCRFVVRSVHYATESSAHLFAPGKVRTG